MWRTSDESVALCSLQETNEMLCLYVDLHIFRVKSMLECQPTSSSYQTKSMASHVEDSLLKCCDVLSTTTSNFHAVSCAFQRLSVCLRTRAFARRACDAHRSASQCVQQIEICQSHKHYALSTPYNIKMRQSLCLKSSSRSDTCKRRRLKWQLLTSSRLELPTEAPQFHEPVSHSPP